MKKIISFFIIVFVLISCEKEFEFQQQGQQVGKTQNPSLTARGGASETNAELVILGKQLQNAYSVKNMQNAFDYYNSLYPASIFTNKIVKATHKYIKILPVTEKDLIYLEDISNKNDNIVLSEYPLDYQVLQEGSDYVDVNYTGIEEFKPLYTVIPINADIDVPYVLIDELYEPVDNEFDIETIALAMANWQDDLIADFGEEVTMQNINKFVNIATSLNRRGKFTPVGVIRMHVYDTNGNEGLKWAKINTGRGIWWHTTYTNEEGMFVATKSYRGAVRIRSAWRNITATLRMTRAEMIGVQVSDHIMTLTSGNNWRIYEIFNAWGDENIWCKGAVHNATIKYFQFCAANAISAVTNANIWVWKTGSGNASTPMLKQYPTISAMANINGWTQSGFWSSLIQHVGTDIYGSIAMMMPHLMPDQIYTKIATCGTISPTVLQQSNRTVEQLVFHESGHFSHALKCGSWNYSKIVAAEIKNSVEHNGEPYFNGQSPNIVAGQQIALAEGWATFTEHKCMQYHYQTISYDQRAQRVLPDYMERFDMYQTPFTFIGRTDANDWFLSGLLWDINDNSFDKGNSLYTGDGSLVLTQIIDNLYINPSLSIIYTQLGSDVYNATDLKTKLLSTYPSYSNQIYELFKSYGY